MTKKDSNSKYYIHPEGWKFASIFFIVSFLISFIFLPLAALGFILTIFTLWFFRNPKRTNPQIPNSIISSADGKVCLIDTACPPEEVGGRIHSRRHSRRRPKNQSGRGCRRWLGRREHDPKSRLQGD